jgi:hypothetical protein
MEAHHGHILRSPPDSPESILPSRTVPSCNRRHNPGDVASKAKMTFPLPDGPSIAVMPFVNMSDDPKQELGDQIKLTLPLARS